ncbi:hypothetical protein GCM10022222_10840 [Amycolatopsis ultiminotia]|uniref:Uncharacterized protein n=1 Tax=Amycolatopsis ultiminotia TaxID=543629 RepID=A0ABP6V972_9PSEU
MPALAAARPGSRAELRDSLAAVRLADVRGPLDRGFVRIGDGDPAGGRRVTAVPRLAGAAVAGEPEPAAPAEETIALAEAELSRVDTP